MIWNIIAGFVKFDRTESWPSSLLKNRFILKKDIFFSYSMICYNHISAHPVLNWLQLVSQVRNVANGIIVLLFLFFGYYSSHLKVFSQMEAFPLLLKGFKFVTFFDKVHLIIKSSQRIRETYICCRTSVNIIGSSCTWVFGLKYLVTINFEFTVFWEIADTYNMDIIIEILIGYFNYC